MSRILLLLEQKENRRLLQAWLSQRYQVIVPTANPVEAGDAGFSTPFDLGIVDGRALSCFKSLIQTKRETEHPVILPFILVTSKASAGMLTQELWKTIDEVIHSPIEKLELLARVEAQLRSRQFSLTLQATNERLEELNELKSRFISMASHELRNPLTAIVAAVRLLERDDLSAERKQRFVQIVIESSKRMTSLLNDVLVLTRGELSQKTFQPSLIDMLEFCENLAVEAQLAAGADHDIIFNHIFNHNPACSSVYADPDLLRHILTNLLSNAVKYSPGSSAVYFDLFYEAEEIIFKIKDEGIGIPVEDQEKLFQSFHRAANVGSIPGTGLGLTIVKQCVDLHGGKITASSIPNGGTTFTVSIPRCVQL